MTLNRWVLNRAFENARIEVGLFNGEREVGVPRAAVPNWKITDRSATGTVKFGPYDQPVAYDRYVLFSGGEKIDTIPEAARAQFPPGFTWEWNPEIILAQ